MPITVEKTIKAEQKKAKKYSNASDGKGGGNNDKLLRNLVIGALILGGLYWAYNKYGKKGGTQTQHIPA